jgi:hypothetical protein
MIGFQIFLFEKGKRKKREKKGKKGKKRECAGGVLGGVTKIACCQGWL